MYFLFPKNYVEFFILFWIRIWALMDFGKLIGLNITGAYLVAIDLIVEYSLFTLFNSYTPLKKYAVFVQITAAYIILLCFAFLV